VTTKDSGPNGVAHARPRRHLIQTIFLWDILKDDDSRPVFYWAAGTLLVGMFVYHWLEGWTYLDALYFSVITLATIGYGDLTPTTPIAKVFTMLYAINGIVVLLALFDRIRAVRVQRRDEIRRRREERSQA
jgi:voltage-gated potassium channel